MSLFARTRRHVDMDRVKELREEKTKEEKIAEVMKQQEEILAELKEIEIKENLKYSNWRRELNERMTSSDMFLTTLQDTGDTVNVEIDVGNSAEFDSTTSGPYDNTVGVNEYVPYDYNIASGVFNGVINSQNGFTFNPPFTSPGNAAVSHRRTYGSYDLTTNKFTVDNDTVSLQAIAGNSTNFLYGIGSNGGTKPLYDLDIYYLEYDNDGNLVSSGDIGSIPKSTHTLTQFDFSIPQELFGKQIQLYITSDDGSNGIHWWLGNSVTFHPTAISSDTNNWFHGILNQDILPAATGYPGMDKTSMAYIIWTNMQKAYAGNSWDTDGSGVAGYPAPVSGGTRKLGEQDGEGNTIPQAMTQADLEYIVNYIETNFAQYHGMTTTMWGITNLKFKRQLPMNVFVGLDDPNASAFVRDGHFDNLTPEQKKRLLEEQLKAGSDYLDMIFGKDVMPKGATEIADIEPQQSFMDIAQGLPYTDSDDAFDDPYYQGPPPDLDDDSDFDPDDFEYARADFPRANPSRNPPPIIDPKDGWERMPGANPPMPPQQGGRYPLAKKKPKSKTVVAHHEPEGKVIKEKKSFKDLTKKIPGYYDGKPSPLGFPVEEPPKMKNGYHPDLVDGKKVAQRYNRLDPISARAMPKTGNPHIDKKVRAAAKKPK